MSSRPAISIHLPRTLFVSSCPIEGVVELDFRQIQPDNIQQVYIKLRGLAKTVIERESSDRESRSTYRELTPLLREDVLLWTRGTAYPPPGSDTLRLPFRFHLPPDLPPSFHDAFLHSWASVRYSVTAVGTRPSGRGVFGSGDRVFRVPIAVVPRDVAGLRARDTLVALQAGVACKWRSGVVEEKLRRGLWGEYATAQVTLLLPDTPVRPLFVPIPFEIHVKTTSAPVARAKADAHPADKPVFPPPPVSYSELEFKLRRQLRLCAKGYRAEPLTDVAAFAWFPGAAVDTDVPEREWVPLAGEGKGKGKVKGVWVQRSSFKSTFTLDCPPSFELDHLKCEYLLELKVPFPGIGNNAHMTVPITITSGLESSLAKDDPRPYVPQNPANILNLKPSYWDASHYDYELHDD